MFGKMDEKEVWIGPDGFKASKYDFKFCRKTIHAH